MRIFCFILCGIFTILFGVGCLSAVETVRQTAVSEKEKAELAEWKEKNNPPAELLMAAKENYARWTDFKTAKDWGITDEELRAATLGEPFRAYTINIENLLKYHKGDTVKSILSDTDLWYFPLIIKGEKKVMLLVRKGKSGIGWRFAGLGYDTLAKELNNIGNFWSQSDGCNPALVNGGFMYTFITAPAKSLYNLTLITKAPYLKKYSTFPELDTIDNVMGWLKPEIKKNIHDRKIKELTKGPEKHK